MAITLMHTPGELKAFRKKVAQFRHQTTFQTPLQNLGPFVAAIASALSPVRGGRIIIEEVIFEPRALSELLARHSLISPAMEDNSRYLTDWSLQGAGEVEPFELLAATLSDPVDFGFVPDPKRFIMYADHDEYATFFAGSKSELNRVLRAISQLGLAPKEYERRL